MGFRAAALVSPQAGEAGGGAQLPQPGFLLAGDVQGSAVQAFGGFGIPSDRLELLSPYSVGTSAYFISRGSCFLHDLASSLDRSDSSLGRLESSLNG